MITHPVITEAQVYIICLLEYGSSNLRQASRDVCHTQPDTALSSPNAHSLGVMQFSEWLLKTTWKNKVVSDPTLLSQSGDNQ